jgi:hypothetical protein
VCAKKAQVTRREHHHGPSRHRRGTGRARGSEKRQGCQSQGGRAQEGSQGLPARPDGKGASEERTNKKAAVIALMKRAKGVTLAEIVEGASWLGPGYLAIRQQRSPAAFFELCGR